MATLNPWLGMRVAIGLFNGKMSQFNFILTGKLGASLVLVEIILF